MSASNMSDFYPGQRWLSETEIESGIGTILAVEHRRVTVLYRATMETRVYATHSAPLSRVRFSAGDKIHTNDGTAITVERVSENEHGVLTYHGVDSMGASRSIAEVDIDHHLVIHDPVSRLLAGQIDDPGWFTLRLQARIYEGMIWQSPVRGLQGARMSLVPHQLYIANQVSRQPSARALLADEVGLGKTIEACLILHRRIVQGQCERALIIAPPALINQWLVELLRRFTLSFSVYDEERCQDMEIDSEMNPFQQAQLILCSLDLLSEEKRLRQALDAGWDMLIVDEAHHLHWQPDAEGTDYHVVKMLSQHINSVLLLTATPEQLGRESHFARLHLLDQERFHDLQKFIDEENEFEPVADLAERILEVGHANDDLVNSVSSYGLNVTRQDIDANPRDIARQLVDLHGTSRLLFRNTRKSIAGFPERVLIEHPLALSHGQYPEFSNAVYDKLMDDDPRINWLLNIVRSLRPEKCLLICSAAGTALELESFLLKREGIRCAAFHEGLSIIQRDRAAAWFAEPGGAEVLLCSEIGSEGRNFQFAHHLILFDLPLNPDLLEQRIGRLDRIGQRQQVNIHVPYIEGTAQQYLFEWYRQVSSIFSSPDPVIGTLFEQHREQLMSALRDHDQQTITALIDEHRKIAERLLSELQHGRERLLSLSSFHHHEATRIMQQIIELDHEGNLRPFMEQIFDLYGVDSEHHSEQREIIRPGDHMIGGHFPHLPTDGTVITFDRDTALVHEDTQFLTWDHPMVTSAIDMVSSGEFGNSSLSVIHYDRLPAGTSLLELLYRVDCPSPAHLPTKKYITEPVIRLLLDSDGNDLAEQHPHELLTDIAMRVEKQIASQAIKAQADHINELISNSKHSTRTRLEKIRRQAIMLVEQEFTTEIRRLQTLRQYNPNISEQDIQHLRETRDELINNLGRAETRLDAVRLIAISD
jgi:ATP-dependent helicase HepA